MVLKEAYAIYRSGKLCLRDPSVLLGFTFSGVHALNQTDQIRDLCFPCGVYNEKALIDNEYLGCPFFLTGPCFVVKRLCSGLFITYYVSTLGEKKKVVFLASLN